MDHTYEPKQLFFDYQPAPHSSIFIKTPREPESESESSELSKQKLIDEIIIALDARKKLYNKK